MEIPAVTIAAPNLMFGARRLGDAVMRQNYEKMESESNFIE